MGSWMPAFPFKPMAIPARFAAAALLLLCAAGSLSVRVTAAEPLEPEQAIRASYRCLGRFDAVDVTALFFNRAPAEVILVVGETATRLPQLPSASGARYGAADQEFWIKGDRASWRVGQGPAMACGPKP